MVHLKASAVFPARLRAARLSRGATQAQLAKACGLTPDWISHFENGRRAPSLDVLAKLAVALNHSIDSLVGHTAKQRSDLIRLAKNWRRDSIDYEKAVKPEWDHGDKYASRRYEGESMAFRWCAEDLEKLLSNG